MFCQGIMTFLSNLCVLKDLSFDKFLFSFLPLFTHLQTFTSQGQVRGNLFYGNNESISNKTENSKALDQEENED